MQVLEDEVELLLMPWDCIIYFANGRLDFKWQRQRAERVRKHNKVQEEK